MDEEKRTKRLKELERANGMPPSPHTLKESNSGLIASLAIIFVTGLAVFIGMAWSASGHEANPVGTPTPISTSAWHVTQPLLPTPTLAPSREWTLATVAPTAVPTQAPVPTWTAVPSSTPAPTWTPYPTLTPAPTWTPAATWTMAPTYTPQPTHTPFPTPTAVPATETPTVIPSATATAAPTLAPPVLPPGPGPETVIVESGGRPWWFDALIVVEIALIVFIVYMEASTWKYRRRPPLATPLPPPLPMPEPAKNTGAAPVTPVTPLKSTGAAPVNTGLPTAQLTVSMESADPDADEAILRELYQIWQSLAGREGVKQSLTQVCREKWGENGKNPERFALVKMAVKWGREREREASQATPPTRPKRPFFVNVNGGRREV